MDTSERLKDSCIANTCRVRRSILTCKLTIIINTTTSSFNFTILQQPHKNLLDCLICRVTRPVCRWSRTVRLIKVEGLLSSLEDFAFFVFLLSIRMKKNDHFGYAIQQ